jgi:hypothetical protein
MIVAWFDSSVAGAAVGLPCAAGLPRLLGSLLVMASARTVTLPQLDYWRWPRPRLPVISRRDAQRMPTR